MNSKLDHMIEVLGWIKEGRWIQLDEGNGFIDCKPPPFSPGFPFAAANAVLNMGHTYRLKPTPVRRPFTEKEAQRLVGCVLVSPDGVIRHVVRYISGDHVVRHLTSEPVLSDLMKAGWHYHLPDNPDNLKPCWVEEVS